jgi:predicted acylesterase/phospholipase RssA
MAGERDVGVVLSGGGINGVLMELGFLQRLRESVLWPRVSVVVGTSSGALSGAIAVLDRLDELEEFMLALQPEQTFRPNRLWRLPFLGLHEYALPRTIESWFGELDTIARELAAAPAELVVLATDLTDDHERPGSGYELAYSSRTTPPEILARAVLASAAVPALVLPLEVGDRIATDGSWVRNFPLGHVYDRTDVELIVAFRYLPQYPRMGTSGLQPFKRRLNRFGRIPPIRALIAELEAAEERAARGQPAHLADMIVRLARVAVVRNTELEERSAEEKDASLRELHALRSDVLALAGDDLRLRGAIDRRFAAAAFPFRGDRIVPRITVRGNVEGVGLDPGFRSSPRWSERDKRRLIRRGYELADRELSAVDESGRSDLNRRLPPPKGGALPG